MSGCEQLVEYASAGVAPALRAVDCLANQAAAGAFGRLFGSEGALLPALTVLLTLYIAFFAFSLLTGRSRLSVSALTPRMLTLGLVLTFATSWVAYQGVVWNLAVGGPDQIAGVLMGAQGPATTMFADRLDVIFAAIQQASDMTGQAAPAADGQAAQAAQGSFTPGNLMWLAALLLLLGTVGVLVTARIALAVLLALGPVFVVFALFGGTRGLTAGWLRGIVLTAITPLFVIVGGALMLELLVPVVQNLAGEGGGIDGRAALALFVIASVHVALMAMVLKISGTIVSAWQVFGLATPAERGAAGAAGAAAAVTGAASVATTAEANAATSPAGRRAPIVLAQPSDSAAAADPRSGGAPSSIRRDGRTVVTVPAGDRPALPPLRDGRARGVGSRFRAKPNTSREMLR